MISDSDVCELVREIFRKLHPDDVVEEMTDWQLMEWVYGRFDFGDWDEVVSFINLLIDFTPVLKSPLTGELYHCLGIQNKSGLFTAIIKKPYEDSAMP